MEKKYTRTAPNGSSEDLALKKLDEIIAAIKTIAEKLDNDTGVTSNDFSEIVSAIKNVEDQLIN